MVVVALPAGEVELPLPRLVEGAPFREVGRGRAIRRDAHRHAARARRDGRGQREQRVALIAEGGGALVLRAAALDASFQVQQRAVRRHGRVARRDATHGLDPAMAGLAGPLAALPQRLAFLDPEPAGMARRVVLLRAQFGREEVARGPQVRRAGNAGAEQRQQGGGAADHVTTRRAFRR